MCSGEPTGSPEHTQLSPELRNSNFYISKEIFIPDDRKVRVAIIGVGNYASALIQGVHFYKDADEDQHVPGLMHANLRGYHIGDIEFTAAFDVVDTKVGKDLS